MRVTMHFTRVKTLIAQLHAVTTILTAWPIVMIFAGKITNCVFCPAQLISIPHLLRRAAAAGQNAK